MDVAKADIVVEMEEEEAIGAVNKILKLCDITTDHIWRFIRNMTLLTMNVPCYLTQKE